MGLTNIIFTLHTHKTFLMMMVSQALQYTETQVSKTSG